MQHVLQLDHQAFRFQKVHLDGHNGGYFHGILIPGSDKRRLVQLQPYAVPS